MPTKPPAPVVTLVLFHTSSELTSRVGSKGASASGCGGRWKPRRRGPTPRRNIRTQISGDFEGAAPNHRHRKNSAVLDCRRRALAAAVHRARIEAHTLRGRRRRLPAVNCTKATLAETGQLYQVRRRRRSICSRRSHNSAVKGVGVRVDARAVVRSKGVAFDDGRLGVPGVVRIVVRAFLMAEAS